MVRLAPTVTVSDLDSVRKIDDYVMKRLPQNINLAELFIVQDQSLSLFPAKRV